MARWAGVGRAVPRVLVRFPVPVLLAVAALAVHFATSYLVLKLAARLPALAEIVPRIATIAGVGALFATAAALFAEGRGWSALGRHLFTALVAASFMALAAFPAVTHSSLSLLLIAGACAVLLAPSGFAQGQAAAFWRHGARTVSGAGTALLGAAVLVIGIMLVEGAVRVLFAVGPMGFAPSWATTYVMPVAFGLVAPVIWLSQIPLPGEGDPSPFVEVSAPLTVARWVMVPLLFVFGAVLIAYATRIAWQGAVPVGQIGRYVPIFGAIGTAVFMMLQHERGRGRRLVDLFCAAWFPLLVVPLVLLGAALWLRIEPLGFTAQRGHLLLVAAWLALITLVFAPRLGRGDLRLIPGVLLVLCLAFAAGPFGMTALANRDQAHRLTALLASAGAVENGRLVPESAGKLDMTQRAQAQSIIRYLGRHDGFSALAPLFAGRDDDPFRQKQHPGLAAIEMKITGFPRDMGRAEAAPDPRLSVSVKTGPALIAEAGGVRVLGPFMVGFGRRQQVSTIEGITTSVEDNMVQVDAADGRSAQIDLASAIQAREKEAVGRPPRLDSPVRIDAPFGPGRVGVVLQGATLSVSATATTVRGGTYFLVLSPAG